MKPYCLAKAEKESKPLLLLFVTPQHKEVALWPAYVWHRQNSFLQNYYLKRVFGRAGCLSSRRLNSAEKKQERTAPVRVGSFLSVFFTYAVEIFLTLRITINSAYKKNLPHGRKKTMLTSQIRAINSSLSTVLVERLMHLAGARVYYMNIFWAKRTS